MAINYLVIFFLFSQISAVMIRDMTIRSNLLIHEVRLHYFDGIYKPLIND